MQISQRNNGNERVIEVKGSLTVTNSPDLKKALLANLKKGKRLELVIDEVADVDLSFTQIIAAAMKTAEKGDRQFTVRTPVPERVVESLRISGLLNHDRCSRNNCLWCAINKQILKSAGDE